MAFSIVFSNVLVMLAYMLCGFLLCKAKKTVSAHAKSFSAFLIYICCPCLVVNSFISMDFSKQNLLQMGLFFVVVTLAQFLFLMILYALLHKKYDDAKYRVLTVGAAIGNVGFFGYPLITSLFPDTPVVGSYATIYMAAMNLFVFTMGVFLLTRKKKYISFKGAVFNPTMLAVIVALPLYLLQVNIPAAVTAPVALLGKMTAPLCMVVLGMRLAASDLKKIFARPFVYAVCLLKLVAFPLFAYGCVFFLPCFDPTFKTAVLVLSATPSAAFILSLAEMHNCEQELSANVVLVTTICCLFTLPLITLIAG